MESEQLESDLWTLYLYAMKSPVTREKYQKRLGKFFDFLRSDDGGSIEEKSRVFVKMARKDSNWAFSNILRFIQFQNSRVVRKEISGATVRNYVKSIKLLLQQQLLWCVCHQWNRPCCIPRRECQNNGFSWCISSATVLPS